ncbi:ImpA family type VI secretion system protein [Vibrio caribbeanicus]|uniref:type VI secretion system protein TssA n=1 Tax=Vibrio caribbeanicus TaxID=701175 RepID=UPI002283CCC1|nr:type VI secretion system ImpA family N-terminal domain-containing protein [Vibrio caribbeanicus]MCY9845567.1 type VI secretion system ImpA family N-terminal domain-containing protein [Vibrio caribbeanicus]
MVNITQLMTPITDESPSGTYLKLDKATYRALRNSYNAAQSSFRQLIETPDASSDQELLAINDNAWAMLQDLTQDALSNKTKDLEILGWFISSQFFTPTPYKNLADAITVLKGFIEDFWQDLHPTLPDNKINSQEASSKLQEVIQFRLRPLVQLVGESNNSTAFFMPLQITSLIGEINLGDYLRAERHGNMEELKQRATQEFNQATQDNLLHLAKVFAGLNDVERLLASKSKDCGIQPINFRFIKDNVSKSINAIRTLTGKLFGTWPLDDDFQIKEIKDNPTAVLNDMSSPSPELPDPSTSIGREVTSIPTQINTQTQLQNRDQAFQHLRHIADFFRDTEPHSPVSFLLERAIRWGYMSLPELIQEMTAGNSTVIQQINQLTGMDNLEQRPLSGAPIVETSSTSTQEAVTPQAISEQSDQLSQDSSQNTTKPQASSTESSSSINDFEW